VLSQMRSARFVVIVWSLIALAFVGGFLLVETSGLLGRTLVTPTTAVAVVNGHEILYTDYMRRVQEDINNAQQRQGRTLNQDETHQIENNSFNQMVMDVLLQQEYERRGITVTDEELRDYARYAPPPWIQSAPDLQTDGRFDNAKYQRLLASPAARQQGLLVGLEQYYRSEVPKQKLIDQITSGVYVTDSELWRIWQDQHDSVQASYVAFHPTVDSNAVKAVTDAQARDYFDKHKAEFKRTGRALLSVLVVPRVITSADTAAARAHALALRNEIAGGAKFEDVAKRESADSVSGSKGGDLGRGLASQYVTEFSNALKSLKVGELSQPVATPFGFHIIRVDERKGDTVAAHHILVRVQPSDSASSRVDRMADSLAKMAASSEQGAKLDTASKRLGLPVQRVFAVEDEAAVLNQRVIPSVSAWAFGGAHPGETSDLFDDENGYYLARLDSLTPGGEPKFEDVARDVRTEVATQQQLEKLVPTANQIAASARTSTLESAARAKGMQVQQTPFFTRGAVVPGIGRFTEAVGAAFGLKVGQISNAVRSQSGVFVLRADKRVQADSTAFEAQKNVLRQQRLNQLRDQRAQMYLQDLRESANIKDRRKELSAAAKRAES
jgi:peptidyl-prolyl cis-trans isomerase D